MVYCVSIIASNLAMLFCTKCLKNLNILTAVNRSCIYELPHCVNIKVVNSYINSR